MNGTDGLAAIPRDLYREIPRTMPIARVDVVVATAGPALLVPRLDEPAKGQSWPSGCRVLRGERLREAAVRKARGETRLDCRVGPVVQTAETIFADGPGGISVHSIGNCFPMKIGAERRRVAGPAAHILERCPLLRTCSTVEVKRVSRRGEQRHGSIVERSA